MNRIRISALGAVVVVLAVASSGCGGSSGSSAESESTAATTNSSGSGGSVVKTVTVNETEYKLNPSTISLTKTGTYVFKGVNDGSVDHALEVEGNGVEQESEDISPGSSGTLKVTLPKAGTYEIYCPIDGHKDMGMEGTITVGTPGAGSGTSTEDMHTESTETEHTTTSGGGSSY